MKYKKMPKDTKGLTPNKAKRRPGGWDPSPVKKEYRKQGR